MIRSMTVVVLAFALLAPAEHSEARRRPIRCCVMVPDGQGGERPWCFNVNARPARFARKVCRIVGGTPSVPRVR
jgi:hypothetical protein